jgi:hypothetical protein
LSGPLARRLAAIAAEIDELAGQREPQGSPADIIAARRAARARKGEVQAMDAAAARGDRLHR